MIPSATRAAVPRGAGRPRRGAWRAPWAYLFLAPFLVLFCLFLLYPIVDTFLLSLQRKEGFGPGEFIGLDNYLRLLRDPRFGVAVRNTVVLILANLFVMLPCAFALALALNSPRLRVRSAFRVFFFLPAAASAVITAMIGYVIYEEQYGFLNSIIGMRVPWLTSATLVLPSIYLLVLWKYVGYNSLYFLAGLQTIDPELVDAARADGASVGQTVRHVYLPLLRPIILVTVVLAILGGAQIFAEPFLLTRATGGPGQGGLTVAMLMWEAAFRQARLGYGAAIAYMTVIGAVAASVAAVALLRRRD